MNEQERESASSMMVTQSWTPEMMGQALTQAADQGRMVHTTGALHGQPMTPEQWQEVSDGRYWTTYASGRCPRMPAYTLLTYMTEDRRRMITRSDYVIMSNSTPVAWRNAADKLWHVPEGALSYDDSTQRKHRQVIRAAVRTANEAVINGTAEVVSA